MTEHNGFYIKKHDNYALYEVKRKGKGTLFKSLGGLFITPNQAMSAIDLAILKNKKGKQNAEKSSTPRDK